MKIILRLAGIAAVLLASFLPMTAANAVDCVPPYCKPNVPTPSGEDGGVLPSESEKPAVIPASDSQAPSGELPFTGGDVIGLTIIGAGALGLGTIMVRRSKAAKATAA